MTSSSTGIVLHGELCELIEQRLDTESATRFIEENLKRFPRDLIAGDVGSADIDWKKFNSESADDNNICHPSPYGYRMIAEFVAGLMRRDER